MVSWWAYDGHDQIHCTHLLCCDPGLAQLAFLMEMDENDVSAVGSLQIADVRGHSQIDARDLDVDPPASFNSEMDLPLRSLPGACPYMQTADTVFAFDASALQLVVSLDAPFRIHDATIAFFDMFQLSASSCIGRSLGLVQGPETNVKLLSSIFETARVGEEANAMLMLYSSSGDGHLFRVSLQPLSSIGTLSMNRNTEDLETQRSCIVSLELVQATPLKDALLPDGRAKVIINADRSATVHVSPEFEKMYGYLWSEIPGRTLGFITGPNTNMALLQQLLNSARNGHSDSSTFFTNTREGQEFLTFIQVSPVVDGGVVSHVVVVCSIVGDVNVHTTPVSPRLSPFFDERHHKQTDCHSDNITLDDEIVWANYDHKNNLAILQTKNASTASSLQLELIELRRSFQGDNAQEDARLRLSVRERELVLTRLLVQQGASGVSSGVPFSWEGGRMLFDTPWSPLLLLE
jgi:PAS domain S-box-containing protein